MDSAVTMDKSITMDRMYYIIDGRGNYYRTNEEDQLIASKDKENADLFDLKEANERIGVGKKMYFYSILPADMGTSVQSEETQLVEKSPEVEKAEEVKSVAVSVKTETHTAPVFEYDLDQLDWKEYLLHFSYAVSGLKKYQDKLNNELSEVDMCICDLLHYLELYDLEDEGYIKAASLIKEYRERRRVIKDKAHMAECFQNTIGTNNNLAKAKEGIGLISRMDNRKYKPRVLSEIFTDNLMKTKRKEQFPEQEEACMTQEEEIIEVMESMERRETGFDNRDNNWGQFVAEQAAFFADAKQYACNLKITLNELDEEIEQVLYDVEDANCNVAQGYKVFKMLKDLRNERKRVAKELDCVQTIIGCFDCEAMSEAYQYCEDRIGEIEGGVRT